jgi:RimJ/RimL family protein N-acetyltransferase
MLTVVPLSLCHAPDLEALAAGDPEVPWASDRGHGSRQEVLGLIARAQRERAARSRETFAICHAGRLVGLAMLSLDPDAPGRAELGYWIARPHRRRGYATHGTKVLLSDAFGRMNLVVLSARCPADNPASARVVEKLGFRLVDRNPTPHPEPIRHYELPRQAWGQTLTSLRSELS